MIALCHLTALVVLRKVKDHEEVLVLGVAARVSSMQAAGAAGGVDRAGSKTSDSKDAQ